MERAAAVSVLDSTLQRQAKDFFQNLTVEIAGSRDRHHSYQGYVLRIDGTCGDESGEFQIAVGKAAHEKHQFSAGTELSGLSVPVPDPRLETAGLYKTSGLKVGKEAEEETSLPHNISFASNDHIIC
jgi:hypothetical protein